MLPADTFVMSKRRLTLFLAKPKKHAEASLKNFELFIYGDTHEITNSFFKNVVKIVTP